MTVEIVLIASVTTEPRHLLEIVVPVDPDEDAHRAVPVARRIAEATGAPVNLVAVALPTADVPDEWAPRLHRWAAEVGAPTGVEIVRSESVADGILDAIAGRGPVTVCMATDAPGRLRDAFELSSAAAVVHQVRVPTVLVGPNVVPDPEPFDDVVAFVDTSPNAPAVVATAADWADAFGVPLWIVEVLDPDLVVSGDDVRESAYVARLAAQARRDSMAIEWEVLHGKDVPAAIARYLEDDHPRALAVLGSHGRRGWAELRLGSVSMRTIHEATVPVLLVPV